MNIFNILIEYKIAFLLGLTTTLKICLLTRGFGILFGIILGLLISKYSLIRIVYTGISTIFGGIPVLVLLYWMYFPMQQALNINIDSFFLAMACFVIVNTILVANIIYEGIKNLPNQYIIAGKLCGLSESVILRKVKVPLIFKHVIGPILIVQITMLHTSIFASLINVDDIFRQIQRINAIIYKPIELYTILALFFVIISVPVYIFADNLKKKYTKDFSERI